jgi:hypothetical protein
MKILGKVYFNGITHTVIVRLVSINVESVNVIPVIPF